MSAEPTVEGVKDKVAGTVDATAYAQLNGIDRLQIEQRHNVVRRGHKKVMIVGAGVSGITQAALFLRHKVIRHDDMVMIDVQSNFGGVWEKNRYPGCACDVPSLLYTNSIMINTEYTNYFASGQQIFEFYVKMAHHFGLNRVVQFKTLVTKCIWDEEHFVWRVEAENQSHGTLEEWTIDILVHAVGAFDRPKFGDSPGLEKFKGQSWHSSRWNDEVDLTEKKVAIVGCGPSAAQIIPEIVDKVGHLTVYMRTPPMVFPRNDFKRSKLFMWSMRNVPLFAYVTRLLVMLQQWCLGAYMVKHKSWGNRYLTAKGIEYLEKQVQDPKLREILRPSFDYFCKRPLFTDTFYPALTRKNCSVVRERVENYSPTGIVSTDRDTHQVHERDFDIIIFGTGFNLAQYMQHETISGLGGVDLQHQWKNYPSAIYGLGTTNYPNFFYVNGPNANTFTSIHHEMNEVQGEYLCRLVKEILSHSKDSQKLAIMPNARFEERWNKEIQQNISHIITQQPSCNSYQKTAGGHNTIIHHLHIWRLWWRLRKINWDEWDARQKVSKLCS